MGCGIPLASGRAASSCNLCNKIYRMQGDYVTTSPVGLMQCRGLVVHITTVASIVPALSGPRKGMHVNEFRAAATRLPNCHFPQYFPITSNRGQDLFGAFVLLSEIELSAPRITGTCTHLG